jgi:P27 family predicted phage terminase small subunit
MVMPRKNTAQHFLEGTKAHPPALGAPTFQGGRPKLPKHLCPAARAEMKRCIKLLEARGTLTEGDVTVLSVYAEIFSRWVLAKQAIGVELLIKTTIVDPHGKMTVVERLNPLLKVVDACEAKLVALAAKLGLTPVDRARSKQTDNSAEKNGIVPGSIGDLYPELLTPQKDVIQFVPIAPEGADDGDENV